MQINKIKKKNNGHPFTSNIIVDTEMDTEFSLTLKRPDG